MNFTDEFTMTIAGEGVEAASTIDVVNPSTGAVFAQAPDCSQRQLEEAVGSARKAFPSWRALPIDRRAAMLRKAGDALCECAGDMARLFTLENGRPVEGALQEIQGAAEWFHDVSKLRPPVRTAEDSESQHVETRYVPLGVVCAITPWNFPISLAVWKIAPALLSGNTMVLKPSPYTPLCTLKLGELLRSVFPAGVLNVIAGGDSLGPKMTSHPEFDKVSFTGSTATGKKVMETASKDLKRVTLELGGNDAAIVLPDADVNEVAEQIFFGSFYNSSQICVATKRLYVHEDIYESLRDKLAEIAKATKMGDGLEQGNMLGPVQNKRQYDRVMNLLNDARDSGLTLIHGADVPEGKGYFVPVTIVDNPPEESRVVQEEAFGPVLPMLRFSSVDEVIRKANASELGLGGSVWTKDVDKGVEIARQLETGTVWINQIQNLRADTPFAGRKRSGLGTEHGEDGLLEFMAPQSVFASKG